MINIIVDEGSFFEIGSLWGRAAITGLARLGGKPVGIISNDCELAAGALDAAGSQKIMRHLKFCDIFTQNFTAATRKKTRYYRQLSTERTGYLT